MTRQRDRAGVLEAEPESFVREVARGSFASVATFAHGPGWQGDPPQERFDETMAIFTLDGIWSFHRGRRRVAVDPSVVILGRQHETYHCSHHEATPTDRTLFVTLRPDALGELLADHPDPVAAELVSSPLPHVTDLRQTAAMEHVARTLWLDSDWSVLRVDVLVLELLLEFRRAAHRRLPARTLTPHRRQAVRDACRFLDEHHHDAVDLSTLAAAVHVSPFHLHRTFKDTTGMTPHQYLTDVRLQRARELLTRTDLPVVDVAELVGFRSASHFARTFRRHSGKTPVAYRRETRNAV